MGEQRSSPPAWVRRPDESAVAHSAFLAYRDLGPARTFIATARSLAKNERLLRRWAVGHRWGERVWRWDLHQASREETVVRQQREAVLRERLEDLDRMGRACLAFFRTMVRRDPETGEISFDTRFTSQVALRFLELALKAQGAFERPRADEEPDERPAADLFGLADGELEALMEAARERADQHHQRKGDGDESDQSSTYEEEDEPHQGPADEEREQDETERG